MDMYSSGEEILIKSRKPYTISKQRERWTEEEHNGFLEALKLYGRAWQRIEEHIGTKTAVQIRSHAQKFFLKLEKDATGKGVLISEVSDIDIPPPRPKKKPNHPYPRKINVPAPTVPVEGNDRKIFIPVSPQLQDKSLQKPGGLENAALPSQDSFGSDILGISLAPPCTSFSCEKPTTASTLGILKFACADEEYAHLVKKVSHEDEFMNEPNQHLDNAVAEHTAMRKNSSEITDLEILQLSPDSVVHRVDSQTCYTRASTEATQRYPGKISVQAVGSSQEPVRLSSQPILYQLLPDQPVAVLNCSDYLASSYTAATREPSSNPPITSSFASSEDGHRSYLQFSSAFSNMVVSTLQQNPAAHATASVAAASSYFPNVDIEAPEEYSGGFPARIIGTGGASPSTTAITAATVAAATAWWASIGVFPFCGPQQSVTRNQSSFTTNNDTGSVTNEKSHQDPTNKPNQPAEVVDSTMFPRRNSAFNPVVRVPAKSEESLQLALITTVISKANSATTGIGIHGSNASSQDRKQVERSSSGSNTNSGTELETDVLEKHDRGNEESNAPDDMHSVDDSSNRRCKIAANINDSWKEVSQEGRVAFRALFSRQVLPQKFVSLHTDSELKKLGGVASPIDLNMAVYGYCSTDHQVVKPSAMERGAGNEEGEGLHYLGLGKLITRRTGFKPYKRCSIEAKDTSGCSQGREKRPRSIMCSEGGEVST